MKDSIYKDIIVDCLGEKDYQEIEYIKNNYCCDCKNKKCRMLIKEKQCVNYVKS